jgi:Fic family protein
MLEKIKMAFGEKRFNSADAEAALGSSRSTVKRFLKDAVENKQVISEGKGPATKYRISD